MDRLCGNCGWYVDLTEVYPEYEYEGECSYRLGPTNSNDNEEDTCTDFREAKNGQRTKTIRD
jgi:hypothetical protein